MKPRRKSTIIRDNEIHDMHDEILSELGDLRSAISKGYIYNKIKERTRLSVKTISYILNHTKKRKVF